jgi:hypothetical protein
MTKKQYLKALMAQPPEWIAASLADPSPSMRPVHLLLHRIALRRIGMGG